jgi:hypothetical protein
MNYQHHPDYTCTETSDGDLYCEHSPELSRSGRIIRDCRRGRNMVSPAARVSKVVESHTPIEVPPEPVEVADLSEEMDPTVQIVKLAGCAAMIGHETIRSGNDVWCLNHDSSNGS